MIINFQANQLEWHLVNNCNPALSEEAIEGIVHICELVNKGEMLLSDEALPGAGFNVAEMLDDLHIEYDNSQLFLID